VSFHRSVQAISHGEPGATTLTRFTQNCIADLIGADVPADRASQTRFVAHTGTRGWRVARSLARTRSLRDRSEAVASPTMVSAQVDAEPSSPTMVSAQVDAEPSSPTMVSAEGDAKPSSPTMVSAQVDAEPRTPVPPPLGGHRRERVDAPPPPPPPPPKTHDTGARRQPPGWRSWFRDVCRRSARRRTPTWPRAVARGRRLNSGNDRERHSAGARRGVRLRSIADPEQPTPGASVPSRPAPRGSIDRLPRHRATAPPRHRGT